MGEKLLKYYRYVYEMNGTAGKTQLAMETKMPAVKAAIQPDSPQNLQIFQKAVAKITGLEAPQV